MTNRQSRRAFDLAPKAAEPDVTPASRQQPAAPAAQRAAVQELQHLAGNRLAQQRLSRQANGRGMQPGPAAQAALNSAGGGQPLPASTRASMELALGVDLSRVRVHNGPAAGEAAVELGARAFSVGRDIFFGPGQYDPTSPNGRDLLAHELAHTTQAGAGRGLDLAQLDADPPDPLLPQSEEVERTEAEPVTLDAPEEEMTAAQETTPAGPAADSPTAGPGAGRAGERRPAQPAAGEAEGAPLADTRPEVTLLMPEPPAALTPPAQERLGATQQAMDGAGASVETLPSADESTTAARGAVEEPQAETQGRAEAQLAEALGARPEPSPEIVELCEAIRQSIREKRPVDEDELVEADPQAMAQEAGGQLNDSVEGDTERVQGAYDPLNEPPEGAPVLTPEPIETPPAEVGTPDPHAAAVAPDPIDPAATDLGPDQAQVDADMEAAGMNSTTAQAIQDPNNPVVQARAARGELAETAQTRPGEVLAAQNAALQQASANMAGLQEQALAALQQSRANTVAGVAGQQTEMVGSEEQMREQLSSQARQIFGDAQAQVNTLLQPLPDTAMAMWRAGVTRLSGEFRQSLNRVKAWIDERHSGIGGAILAGWDALTGLPGWVTREYDRAEKQFGDDVCELILEISTEVNGVIATCEAIIDDARVQIDALYSQDLPEGLREWAAAERERMQGQLDGLQNQVATAQQDFNRNLSREAVRAVREVQDEVATLREEAKGLIGRIADAIGDFLDDPIRAIINGLLSLVGIQPSAFWALVNKVQQVISDIADDPERFINNLVKAIGQGFQQFFDNILTHLLHGFIDWLLGGLTSLGVQIPTDFSLKSLITFFLQLMGITWPRIRQILVRHIGEQNVALIEQAWSVIAALIDKGPEGIFELIKEQLDPANILKQIMDAAIDFVVEALIKNVAMRVIALFNPVGAIVQAIELIYKVLKWIFTNAARLFSFVETVVNGLADIIAGNIGGMAKAVEGALAKLIPPVIDFLASLIGLGDLPNKVVETVQRLQGWVESILERVIGWLAEQGRRLLAAVGLGPEEEGAGAAGDTELGMMVTFSAQGESHRQWIETRGSDAVLMVASATPTEVEAKLSQWEAKLSTQFAEGEAGRAEAAGLIASARVLLGQADVEADTLLLAFQRANDARGTGVPEIPDDDSLEAKQQALGIILSQLFRLFGGDPEQKLEEIASALPSHADKFAETVHRSWYDNQISKIKVGNEEDSPRLWNAAILSDTEAYAFAYTRERSLHQTLMPYFAIGDRERKADTAAFYEYVYVTRSVTHGARPAYLGRLGAPLENKLKNSGDRVDAVTTAGDDYKTRLKQKLQEISYEVAVEPYGRFNLPTERIPDHSRFKPVSIDIIEENGRRVTSYVTEAGQTFEVVEDLAAGLSKTIHGTGLRFRSERGRGVLKDSPGFQPNLDLNRAHLIADEFSGSGYKESANIVTTSDYYNQTVMRGAEEQVGASIANLANANGVPASEVLLDMSVEVTFGQLLDQYIITKLESQSWLPKDVDVQAELELKVREELSHPLKRVTGIRYSWRAYIPASGAETTGRARIGPDLYLLIDYRP